LTLHKFFSSTKYLLVGFVVICIAAASLVYEYIFWHSMEVLEWQDVTVTAANDVWFLKYRSHTQTHKNREGL